LGGVVGERVWGEWVVGRPDCMGGQSL